MKPSASWLERRAAHSPDRVALVTEGRAIRYAELDARAAALASRMRALGVREGDAVAILLRNSAAFAELLHAVDRCRAVAVPLNVRLTVRDLASRLRDCRARHLVHGADDLAKPAEAACLEARGVGRLVIAGATLECVDRGRDEPDGIDLGDALAVLYTSGTTGDPKGALLTRSNFSASASASALHQGAVSTDRWLVCMPLFHVGGLSILTRSVLQGSAAVIHERFDPEAVDASLDADAITIASLVPTMLDRLLAVRGDRPAPTTLRCVLLGGGPAPLTLLERARDLGFPIAPTYGLTEATSQVATRLLDDNHSPLDAGLAPLPGIDVRIAVADEAQPGGAPGEAGEILVRGPIVTPGYANRDDASEAALRGGWLHTGDIGCLDAGGRLRVLDRRSDLIVSGGENVYPAEIETVLAEHPAVIEAAVAAVADAEFGARPAAWIVVRDPAPGAAELEAFCRKHLAGYKIPVAFRCVESLPRNAAGKLLRRRLGQGEDGSASLEGAAESQPGSAR